MAIITTLSPENEAYNVASTTSIAFHITDILGISASDISVEINSVFAIQNGSYVNGYSGDINYYNDPYDPYYTVSIFPPYIFPNYVGFTITVVAEQFSYYFKSKDITTLLITSKNVRDLYSTETHIFAVTDAGLDVIDISAKQNIAHVSRTGGFTAVWCKHLYTTSDCVYLGTSNAGIYKITLANILLGGDVSAHCFQFLTIYSSPSLSSNNIIKIHGYGNTLVILCPNNVDFFVSETIKYNHYFNSTLSMGFVFLTSSNDVYYSGNDGLHVKYNIEDDWIDPDFSYSVNSTPPIGSNNISGLFVAASTHALSTTIDNTLFVATANGLYIIQEIKGDESNASYFSFGHANKTHNVLDSDICTILIADKIPEIGFGRIYVGISGKFYIIDIGTCTILSYYTVTSGEYGDYLDSSVLQGIT